MGKLLMSELCPCRVGIHETEQTEVKEAEAAGAESTWLG
jgi:hypothetical protein